MSRYCIILSIIILLSSLVGCQHSNVDVSEYKYWDANIYWTDGAQVINKGWDRIYYEIEDVPKTDIIACRFRPTGIGELYHPAVMLRKDMSDSYQLDVTSAKLVFVYFYANLDQEEWLDLGDNLTESILVNVDEEIAVKTANVVTASTVDYVNLYDDYDGFMGLPPGICETVGNADLAIQFNLIGYDNLIWLARIAKIQDDYLLVLRDPDKIPGADLYVLCDDETSAFLDAVIKEYDLIVDK